MTRDSYSALLVSDFNLENFKAVLNNDPGLPKIIASSAPYGQVTRTLLDKDSDFWKQNPNFVLVWTQPHGVLKSFSNLVEGESAQLATVHDEVDSFAELILSVSDRAGFVLVPSWVWPDYFFGSSLRDLEHEAGAKIVLTRLNLRLAEKFQERKNVFLLDGDSWIKAAGKTAFSPKHWYMAKVPYAHEVWIEAVKDIKFAVATISGTAKKLLILDLDDTLWGGIVGDVGWEKLLLGGHDPIGEAYLDFQRAIKTLKNRGTLLAIVSKNDEAIALEAIDNHPEMILRRDDFCSWRINWNDKAANIAELVSELNLGMQSVVFLDDNPVERARVREALPEILVPDIPEDKMLYRNFLVHLRCFDSISLSKEDTERTKYYHDEKARSNLRAKIGSFGDWLATLDTVVVVEALNPGNLARVAQLLNKTNQMNLSTRRLTESELIDWAKLENRAVKTFRVSDKFGDSGLTGILSWEISGDRLTMIDFILSCRVMGRQIEELMLFCARNHAAQLGLKTLTAQYVPTQKNTPCLRFLENSGADVRHDQVFEWDCSRKPTAPKHITLISD